MSNAWRWIAGIVVTLLIVMLIAFVRESRASRYWALGAPMSPRVTITQSQIDAPRLQGAEMRHVLAGTDRR